MLRVPAAWARTGTVLLLLLSAGCSEAGDAGGAVTPTPTTVGTPAATDSTTSPTPTATATPDETGDDAPPTRSGPANLSSTLYGLTTAEDPAAYADTRGLAFRDGRVEVLVALSPGRDLPAGFDADSLARRGDAVRAAVPVASLVGLSEHPNVTAVREPPEPAADAGGADA